MKIQNLEGHYNIVRNDIKLLLLTCYQAKMYSSKIYLSKNLSKNVFCRNTHEADLIFDLANKAIPNKNGVLDILSHMVREGIHMARQVTIFMNNRFS